MDLTRSTQAAAAKPARSVVPENEVRSEVRTDVRHDLRNAVRNEGERVRRASVGYGLPCANCRLYYPANLDSCPACNSRDRISPNTVPAIPKPQAADEAVPENVLEQEREAFLQEFKSQLFAAHAEVSSALVG